MFVLAKERLAWWPVTFPSVTDAGGVIDNRIELRFVILGEEEFPSFVKRLTAPAMQAAAVVDAGDDVSAATAVPAIESDIESSSTSSARTLETLLEVVRDWRHVGAENGEPLPFNRENFGALLNVPNAAAAIGRGYVACRSATPEIREGN